MAKRSIDKQLLSNYLRHADGHNKIQEEQEMWRIRSLELKRERIFDDWERRVRQPPLVRGRLVSDTLDNDSRGYSSTSPSSSPGQSHSSNHIRESRGSCKQLMKQEERDPFLWGHAGFKELYPDEFASSDEEEGREGESEKRKERKGHSRKRKREHKDKRKTKRRKLESREEKSEASSRGKKRQKARKRKRRREREQESSTSGSDDDSYSDNSSDSERVHKHEKKRTSRHKQK